MEKLPMCRICLVENDRMYVVVNKELHELYERLTDIPFITKDSRPMLACFLCCTKLKQCYRFLRKCLEGEKNFAQMLNEDYEPDLLINPAHSEVFNGFSNSPIELISIVDDGQTESRLQVKEELPAVCEGLDDITTAHHAESDSEDDVPLMKVKIEEKSEQELIESRLEYLNYSYPVVERTSTHHAESGSENDVPLIEVKSEDKDEREIIGEPDTKNPKLNARGTILEAAVSTEQKKNENNRKLSCVSKIIKKTQKYTSEQMTKFKEHFTKTKHVVNSSIHHTALSTSCRTNINKDDIKRYQIVSVQKKPFECDFCKRSFSLKNYLTRHIRTHTGDKPFKCDICQRSFNLKNDLIKHIRTHIGEKPFKCDFCQRSFSLKNDLIRHIRTHTGEKPFKCDICQRSFNRNSLLTRHIHVHTGEKPFKCDFCQRSFSLKNDLIRHIRTHTGEKPFKCDICQRSFNRNSLLTRHIHVHTGEKPFKCDICQRSFKRKNHVTSHSRLHTVENLFKCEICQRSFNRKSSFTIHIRNHAVKKKT